MRESDLGFFELKEREGVGSERGLGLVRWWKENDGGDGDEMSPIVLAIDIAGGSLSLSLSLSLGLIVLFPLCCACMCGIFIGAEVAVAEVVAVAESPLLRFLTSVNLGWVGSNAPNICTLCLVYLRHFLIFLIF